MALNRQGSTRATKSPSKSSPAASSRRGGGGKRPSWLVILAWLVALGILTGVGIVGSILFYYSTQVPDFRAIENYRPALISRVYDRNGELLAEYATERRIWVPYQDIPEPLINAFLAAEDASFFEHGGYDLKAIIRAALVNLTTDRMQGGSTITQQVAKTYLLSAERTLTRKIKELILSWQIERAFSKNEILELYLNRIFLGNGSYGVAAAAQTYFSKPLGELNVQERALLAGMPQAPSRYNPLRNPDLALARRNTIIGRMEAENFITPEAATAARNSPLGLNPSPLKQGEDAPHFAEHIRRLAVGQYGEQAVYEDGLSFYTTLDLDLQAQAEQAVMQGLKELDRRQGWRGPIATLPSLVDWATQLGEYTDSLEYFGRPAVVLEVQNGTVTLGLPNGAKGVLQAASARWTGKGNPANWLKPKEVVRVNITKETAKNGLPLLALTQKPAVQGALVAIDVATGEVRAMVGGIGDGSGFNRAIQAKRQVGSSFKPFVYAAAMQADYTPASTVLDAPVVFRNPDGTDWKPGNYDNEIGGPTTLRVGLEKSRNLMTVRLAQDVGLRRIANVAQSLGITEQIPITDLSIALGTLNLPLLEMTNAYATLARQGEALTLTVLRRVQDAAGATLYRAQGACEDCLAQLGASPDAPPALPPLPTTQALSPQHAYQVTSMLQGAIQRGTGVALRSLGHPIAGKTGTTDNYVDAWFIGYTPSLAVGVWVGYDTPKSLGHGETGSRAALPIWKDFMTAVLQDKPAEDFPVPNGLEFVRIDADSGLLPGPTTARTLTEVFTPGTAPTETTPDPYADPFFGGGQPDGDGGGGLIDNLLRSFGIF